MSLHVDDADPAAEVADQLNDYIEELCEHVEDHELIPVDVAPSEPPQQIVEPPTPGTVLVRER